MKRRILLLFCEIVLILSGCQNYVNKDETYCTIQNETKTDDITRQRFFSSQEEEALASLQSAECERSEICSRIKMNSEELKNLLKNFREIWENITYNERIELIDLLIEKITLNAESGDIFITYKNSNTISSPPFNGS